MKISAIIEQLRQYLPPLAGQPWGDRVAGAAELSAVQDKARLDPPALYVVLGEDTARVDQGHLHELITEKFFIIAVLSNQDRRGQRPQDLVQDLRTGIFKAILNWQPDSFAGPVEYLGSQFINMDAARYFHRFDFQRRMEIDESDGFLPEHENFDKLFAEWAPEGATADSPNPEEHIEGIYTS
jgi:hypothetical protein